ncbi:MAG TPA: hypothetical protein VIL56_08935 [Gaiellaceae bacterium]|jgi:hypothetical protein
MPEESSLTVNVEPAAFDGPADAPNDERGHSTVTFPYSALTDGEAVARELQNYGGAASPEDLANALGQKSRSGAFRQKVSSARLFGLVSVARGEVALNPLGRKILDPERQDEARVEAFFNVPFYKDVFETYRGETLPKPSALDADFVRRGVSPKSAATARQVFMRSAELAGFFRRGPNRLILPPVGAEGGDKKKSPPEPRGSGDRTQPSTTRALDAPLITLLREGADWTPEQTHEYVDGLRKLYRALTG